MKAYKVGPKERSAISGIIRNQEGEVVKGIARRGVVLYEGDTLEAMIRRMVAQGEPIGAEVGLIGNDEGGSNEQYDITTDKFDTMIRAKAQVVQMGVEGRLKQKEAKMAADAAKASGEDTAH